MPQKKDREIMLPEQTREPDTQKENGETSADALPDVMLHVPTLELDEIKLTVEGLNARVSLSAQLANLIRLDVGAHVDIDKLDLDIKGVNAKAILDVRLNKVNTIFARALQTLEMHPDILGSIPPDVMRTGGKPSLDGAKKTDELSANQKKDVTSESKKNADSIHHYSKENIQSPEPVNLAKGVTVKKGSVEEPIQGVSKDFDRSIRGKFHETEEQRHHFLRQDKEPSKVNDTE